MAGHLLAGTPALTMIGAIGASLTVILRRGGLLMAVLMLPLSVPVLDFRRGGGGRSGRRLQDAVPDPLRPDARRRGAHASRRGRALRHAGD